MRVNFDCLNHVVEINEDKVTTICFENKVAYRKVLMDLLGNSESIVFSKDFKPLKNKTDIAIIHNYFDLDFSSTAMKKIYDSISSYCVDEMPNEILECKNKIFEILEKINFNFDYDFEYDMEFEIKNLLKAQNYKPCFNKENIIENLLDYIFLMQKYFSIKLFVFLNLHIFFTEEEIKILYCELLKKDVRILVIEGDMHLKTTDFENIHILDSDLCEIFNDSI